MKSCFALTALLCLTGYLTTGVSQQASAQEEDTASLSEKKPKKDKKKKGKKKDGGKAQGKKSKKKDTPAISSDSKPDQISDSKTVFAPPTKTSPAK